MGRVTRPIFLLTDQTYFCPDYNYQEMVKSTRILFICLGNIIRSPLAERLFEREVIERGLVAKYVADSAATSKYEIGNPPDPRMLRVAARRGFQYSHLARQIKPKDIDESDLLIIMDLENKSDIESITRNPEQRAKIHLMREFDPDARGAVAVPDPWYGGPSGFEDVYDIIERSVRGLLDRLESGDLK
jgi:protein-tyrosine phosphatase